MYYKETEYYLNKLDNGEKLTERECLDLVYEFGIENNYGDNHRWSRMVETICDLNGRYFSVFWDQGLTELQNDACYGQPIEVELNEYDEVRTVHIREWRKKNDT